MRKAVRLVAIAQSHVFSARLRALYALLIVLAALVACSCPPPAPSISSISPSSATAGGNSFVLTINGSNFHSASVVTWNGASLPVTFINSNQLTATVPATDIAQAGTAVVLVLDPPSGGTTSVSSTGTASTSPTCGGSDSNNVSFTVSQ